MGSNLDQMQLALKKQLQQLNASTYLVAVSGGLDSMLLLNILNTLKAPICALHVNYRLRGEDSELDAQLVEAFCQQQHIKLHKYCVSEAEQKALKAANLQAKAREIRYAFFNEIRQQYPNSVVCTAQHADDQIETFWLQLTRGAGMKGLAGMQVLSNQVFRPFLKWHKQDLMRAAQELDLKWREDQSNNSLVYRRNLWRKQLLPDLEKQIPDLKASTSLLQNYFRKEVTAQTQALDTYQNHFNLSKSISLKEISEMSAFQFIELFKYFEIPNHVIQRIPELFTAANGKALVWISENQKQAKLVTYEQKLWLFLPETEKECPFEWELESDSAPEPLTQFELKTIYLDAQKIVGTLNFRALRKEDMLFPKGMSGKKSAFEILKENKIPADLRSSYFGLFDQEKLILIPEMKLDKRALADEHTKQVLRVSIKKKQ
jgi:tRNA(Ile)-lysidine synthase